MTYGRRYFNIALIVWCFASCTTTRPVDNAVLEHQQQLTELEDRNQDLERRLTQYDDTIGDCLKQLETIRARSTGMEGTIDETIELFNQYQHTVDNLIQAYRALQNSTKDNRDVGDVISGASGN
jgi:chromosome segregation ATPase